MCSNYNGFTETIILTYLVTSLFVLLCAAVVVIVLIVQLGWGRGRTVGGRGGGGEHLTCGGRGRGGPEAVTKGQV